MLLTRKDLTAAHFLAYTFCLEICQRFAPAGGKVLDFGSRYSKMPAILAANGFDVTCYDRDPKVVEWQKDFRVVSALEQAGIVDAVTACWAVQHNTIEEMPGVLASIRNRLPAGGVVCLVGSWSRGDSYYQAYRADPQWVLGRADYERLVAGMTVVEQRWFWYHHATVSGDWFY